MVAVRCPACQLQLCKARGSAPHEGLTEAKREDIEHFDHVLAMTRGHLVELRWLAPRELVDKPQLLMSYAPPLGILDIPDPFGGTADDYERAIGMIESATKGLLARLTPEVRKAI